MSDDNDDFFENFSTGKTTFIKEYASYLLRQGLNIGILENDFGAVNVDMMLIQELQGEK